MDDTAVIILVVEDDATLRLSAEDTLLEVGFKVELVASGTKALALLDKPDAAFKALITDVNLGSGPNGWEVARRAREVFPTIPVVYVTGDSAAEWTSQGVPNSILIAKPFIPAQLITAVTQLLNAAPPPMDAA
jgi:DNA-binding response OmpR family regulator